MSGEGPHTQKFVAVRLLGASPYMGDMYQFGVLPITFFNVTLLFRQAYRWDRWTDLYALYVTMRG